MENRRVLVTGVGRGLGRTIAEHLIAGGAVVWGSTRSGETDLPLTGCIQIDQADEASVVAGLAELGRQTDALDVVVNCAGVDAQAFGAAAAARGPFDLDAVTFNAVINTNVTGPMVLTREALPLLRRGTSSLVLNITSQLGSMKFAANAGRDTSYCVSKAALNMLSIKTAGALKSDGIALVMLHPGWVRTDMGGPEATLTTEESAAAIIATTQSLTLADTGRFITWDGRDHPW